VRRAAGEVADERASMIVADIAADGGPPALELRLAVYRDGFSRQALNAAIVELAKAHRSIERRLQVGIEAMRLAEESRGWLEEHERTLAELQVETEPVATPTVQAAAMSCARCGAALLPGDRFCGSCGAPVATAPLTERPTTCATCGASLAEGARFCSSCGAPAIEWGPRS
jgi:hypothetical protein